MAVGPCWFRPTHCLAAAGKLDGCLDGQNDFRPVMVTNDVPLDQIPILHQSGAVLPLAPEMQYTGQLPWDPITLDLYPRAGKRTRDVV